VWAYLEEIERQFGYFRNDLRTLVMPGVEGKATMARLLRRLRAAPPKTIGPHPVTACEDLQDETTWLGPLKGDTDRAARNFLIYHLGDAHRISLRPSGTEPKAKFYIEVSSPPGPAGSSPHEWRERCAKLDALAEELAQAFLKICREP
jgi:phosphoglucomutase/phosphomannomutase